MLSNKEITGRFEVQLGTLYNWKKTKPKLYKYLQNADFHSDRNEEINILLEHYLKQIDRSFCAKEIEHLVASNVEPVKIEEVERFEIEFMKVEYKTAVADIECIMRVYDKLKELNIIEKYILYKKIYRYRKLEQKPPLQEYFKHYIK
ncbi:MAG: hypothetical protein ACQESH_08560 [Campylobacterota bacterium]